MGDPRSVVVALLLLPACARKHPPSAAPEDAAAPTPAPVSTSVPVVAVPAGPPYDRAADVENRIAIAHADADFGAGAAVTVESDLFVLVGKRQGATYTASATLAHDAVAALFNERFFTRPDRPVTLYVFPEQGAYQSYCLRRFTGTATAEQCTRALGFYHRETRELLANLGSGLTTLSHELVHPLVESDFPRAPLWLNEGLAALFESPAFPKPGEIHGQKNWRLRELRAAMRSKGGRAETRIDALFRMSDPAFRAGDENLHYAVARYACQWLDERGKLWAFYQAWRDSVGDDPTGERAFERVVGETTTGAEGEWEVWLAKL